MTDDAITCRALEQCKGSIAPGVKFYPGQMPHIGPHYDMYVDGRPWRVVCIGMDIGRPHTLLTLEQRAAQLPEVIKKDFDKRHPHMRGTTSALRLAFGRLPGTDGLGDYLFMEGSTRPVHVMNAYALLNLRLCSAIKGSTESHGTSMMSANCARHLREQLRILEPQLVIVQGGAGTARFLREQFPKRRTITEHLCQVDLDAQEILWADFTHPSAHNSDQNWGRSSATPYLQGVVQPTLQEAWRLGR